MTDTRIVRLKPAPPLAGKWRFQGVFPYTPIHGQIRPTFDILGATQKLHGLARRGERHERHADEHLIGGLVIEPDLTTLHRHLRWPGSALLLFAGVRAGSGVDVA